MVKEAKVVKKEKSEEARPRRRSVSDRALFTWPFSKMNYILLGVAVAIIGLGYIFMGIGPYDSFSSMTVSPLLLVIGYIVAVPLAIVYKEKEK